MNLILCSSRYYITPNSGIACSSRPYTIDYSTVIDRFDDLEKKIKTLETNANSAVPEFDIATIDPVVATQMFTAGFLLCVVPWAAFFGIAKLLETIRSL